MTKRKKVKKKVDIIHKDCGKKVEDCACEKKQVDVMQKDSIGDGIQFRDYKKNPLKLTVCMILKNEGKTIYRCLDSMKTFIDEWIIGIDESCNDNTVDEVFKFFKYPDGYAEQFKKTNECECSDNTDFNSIIYPFKWQDNFSKTRNEGMDMATGDFILIMDGHEYFPEDWYNITENKSIRVIDCMKKVKEVLAKKMPDETHIQLYQQPFTGMIPNNFFLQPRIYRNGFKRIYEKEGQDIKDVTKFKEDAAQKIRFNRAAHNTIVGTDFDNVMHLPEVIIVHDAPADNRKPRKKQRLSMNVDAILKDLKKNPKDTRAMFYLGNTYLEGKEYQKAIVWFDKYLRYRKDEQSEKYQVLLHKALAFKEIDKGQEMRNVLYQAVAIDPLRRDAYAILGDLYAMNGRDEEAIYHYVTCLNLNPKPSRMFQNGAGLTWDPHQRLAFLYAKHGQKEKAIAHLQTALKFFHNDKWVEQIKEWSDNKKNILVIDQYGSFTVDFIEHLKSKYNVIVNKRFDTRLALWADYIWCEWGDDNAYISSSRYPAKTVVRIHGYEAYTGSDVKFNSCKKVVFVSEHIKKKMVELYKIDDSKVDVIYNGVNTDKFYIKDIERDSFKNVGVVGFLNSKKNPMLLARIIKANPDYVFNLRVTWQDAFLKAGFENDVKDCKNIIHHAWYKDLNDFWNKMDYVLSTSIIESFSYNIAEAMACGCKPYIYNWDGAKDIWKSEWIFDDMPEFAEVENRQQYRDYIVSNYPLARSLNQMEGVLIA